MANWRALEMIFTEALKLRQRPVAITFADAEPTGVRKFSGKEPSGCSFWRLAAAGEVFYTLESDHLNCAVGTFTHSIEPPPERKNELEETLKLMFSVDYIRPEDLPGITRLKRAPKAVIYAPLAATPQEPSVVTMTCRPAMAMLLNEAVMHAKVDVNPQILGRPTCMALPAAIERGTTLSLGCIGNRVYTGAAEDEMYAAVPGKDLEVIAQELKVITNANHALKDYARERRAKIATA